jgi:hypothetical protein
MPRPDSAEAQGLDCAIDPSRPGGRIRCTSAAFLKAKHPYSRPRGLGPEAGQPSTAPGGVDNLQSRSALMSPNPKFKLQKKILGESVLVLHQTRPVLLGYRQIWGDRHASISSNLNSERHYHHGVDVGRCGSIGGLSQFFNARMP